MSEDRESSVTFSVPAEPRSSRIVRDRIAALAERAGIATEDVCVFLTAIGEAIANAVEHSGAASPIEVHCRTSHDRIVATVRDFGVGLAEEHALAKPIPHVYADRGRGLPIMRRCCDLFSVNRAPGGGTFVLIGRYVRLRRTPGSAGGFESQHSA